MQYYTITPPESLRHWVRCFWVLEGSGTEASPYVHRSMADGCPELIFHYKGRFLELSADNSSQQSFIAGLHGQSAAYRRFGIDGPFGIFGVYLYPYVLPEWLGIPAPEFSGQMVDIDALPLTDGGRLYDNMMLAADNLARLQVIIAYLSEQQRKSAIGNPGIAATLRHLLQAPAPFRVSELAARNFLSVRQFERSFKAAAGFSPKLYTRIVRFQGAMQQYGGSFRSLSDLAYDCGYYDQAHFIHEFRQFSGHDPKGYFSGLAEGTEWRNA